MISTITTEIAEPTISASVTTMSQLRENATFQRQGKQSVSKTNRTGNFDRKQSYGAQKTGGQGQYETCKPAASRYKKEDGPEGRSGTKI